MKVAVGVEFVSQSELLDHRGKGMSSLYPKAVVFDDSHYAASPWRKVKRSFQLGPRYYLWDLPQYLIRRRALRLPAWDFAAFLNPLREFRPGASGALPLPPGYSEVLQKLAKAGVRMTLPPTRLKALVGVWWATRNVPGEVIECGSYRGATALALALLGGIHQVRQRTLLLDIFSGVPPMCRRDLSHSRDEFVLPADWVHVIQRQAESLGVLDRVEIHQGLFADTFSRLQERRLHFAFIHIDANLYQSTLEACAFTLPRITLGGAVVFDDYNGPCDLGARLAIDQSLAGTGLKPLPLGWSSAYVRV